MSDKKNRERAEKGEVFREGKIVKLVACPFPACTGMIQPGSEYGACATHTKLIKDVLFILYHTRRPGEDQSLAEQRAEAGKPGSRIVLPGTRAFQEALKRV
jgi:hypothetical protein